MDASTSYFDFAHADYAAINLCLAAIDWNDIFSRSVTVEDSWSVFENIINDILVALCRSDIQVQCCLIDRRGFGILVISDRC